MPLQMVAPRRCRAGPRGPAAVIALALSLALTPVLTLALPLAADTDQPPAPTAASAPTCALTAKGEGLDLTEPSFAAWRDAFARAAIACGVRPEVAGSVLQGVRIDPNSARLDRRQAEYNSTFMGYLQRRIDAAMIRRGRARWQQHAGLLDSIEARYGVAPAVLVALWGLESGFGSNQGDTPVLNALATLAYEGRRRDFYQQQLLAALQILDAGDVDLAQLRGSWAGAMGQVQFMPTTFRDHALDADGDGRRDLWGSTADALTSAANYLAESGWHPEQPWGVEVRLPPDFDAAAAEPHQDRPTADWAAQGLRLADGTALTAALPELPARAAVALPSGVAGPAFLVFDNFHVLLEWNRSLFFALSVGYFAQRLAGGPALVGQAPAGERALRRAEVMDLQEALNALGLDAGALDGMVGVQTRAALRRYQVQGGLTADAYPTPALIARIRAEAQGRAGDQSGNPSGSEIGGQPGDESAPPSTRRPAAAP